MKVLLKSSKNIYFILFFSAVFLSAGPVLAKARISTKVQPAPEVTVNLSSLNTDSSIGASAALPSKDILGNYNLAPAAGDQTQSPSTDASVNTSNKTAAVTSQSPALNTSKAVAAADSTVQQTEQSSGENKTSSPLKYQDPAATQQATLPPANNSSAEKAVLSPPITTPSHLAFNPISPKAAAQVLSVPAQAVSFLPQAPVAAAQNYSGLYATGNFSPDMTKKLYQFSLSLALFGLLLFSGLVDKLLLKNPKLAGLQLTPNE